MVSKVKLASKDFLWPECHSMHSKKEEKKKKKAKFLTSTPSHITKRKYVILYGMSSLALKETQPKENRKREQRCENSVALICTFSRNRHPGFFSTINILL